MTADRTFADNLARRRALTENATPGPLKTVGLRVGDRYAAIVVDPRQSDYAPEIAAFLTVEDARHFAAHDPEIVRALWDVAEAAEPMADEDYCTGFNTTEFGCTCPVHALITRVRALAAVMRERSS